LKLTTAEKLMNHFGLRLVRRRRTQPSRNQCGAGLG
jgi:hypothetical protein